MIYDEYWLYTRAKLAWHKSANALLTFLLFGVELKVLFTISFGHFEWHHPVPQDDT